MVKIRETWNKIAYQSTVGIWTIKIVLAIVIFVSLSAAIDYGRCISGSFIGTIINWANQYVKNINITVTAIKIIFPVIWIFAPVLGTFTCSLLLYSSFASISPIVLGLAFFLLILFQFEDRPVTALSIALPSVIFLTDWKIGILMVVLSVFMSMRQNNGIIRTVGIVYWALLELGCGAFGRSFDSTGVQVTPAILRDVSVYDYIANVFTKLEAETVADNLLKPFLIVMAIYFVVGAIFAKALERRFIDTKLQIELFDAILLASLLVLLGASQFIVNKYTLFKYAPYGYGSIAIQLLAAYVLSRPFAGDSPNRGALVGRESRNYIFISYAHSDLERVKPYLKMLSKNGYEFWYDDSIKSGSEWQGVIASNLANCTCFLAFISEASINSEYCLKEINYATSKSKPMAVIMLDDVMLPPVLEMHLASLQAIQRTKFESDDECMNKAFEMEQLNCCKY